MHHSVSGRAANYWQHSATRLAAKNCEAPPQGTCSEKYPTTPISIYWYSIRYISICKYNRIPTNTHNYPIIPISTHQNHCATENGRHFSKDLAPNNSPPSVRTWFRHGGGLARRAIGLIVNNGKAKSENQPYVSVAGAGNFSACASRERLSLYEHRKRRMPSSRQPCRPLLLAAGRSFLLSPGRFLMPAS